MYTSQVFPQSHLHTQEPPLAVREMATNRPNRWSVMSMRAVIEAILMNDNADVTGLAPGKDDK